MRLIKKGETIFFRGDEVPPGYRELKRVAQRFGPPPWGEDQPRTPENGITCESVGIKVLVKR